MGEYKVYCYISPSNKRYIGQTKATLNQRSKKDGEGYRTCPAFYKAIQKYGWEWFKNHREILEENLTKQAADELEKYYISYYHTDDKNFGYNLLPGGAIDTSSYLGESVLCFDLKNHKIYKFKSTAEAAKELGTDQSSVCACCLHQRQSFKGQYTAYYEKDYNLLEDKNMVWNIKPYVQLKLRKQVYCIELDTIYESITEASKQTGASRTHISSCCNGKRESCGQINGTKLHWRYV